METRSTRSVRSNISERKSEPGMNSTQEPKPTQELESMLEGTHPDHLSDFLKNNRSSMADSPKAFYYYMKDTLESKRILLKDVYSMAGVTESYGSKILSMEKHTTNRDLILRLCIAGHFTREETDKALKLYGFNTLYAKDPRDACIIVALNHRKYMLCDVDDMLAENGFEKISDDV